jgi:RelE toxin of RelE / RelB toxin-antitoxin system
MTKRGGHCVRVFVTKSFRRFQRKERIADAALCEAVRRQRAAWLMQISVVGSSSSGCRGRAKAAAVDFVP